MREQTVATIVLLPQMHGEVRLPDDSESCTPRISVPAGLRPARCRPIRIKTREFQQLIDDMIETMYEYSGVGLAAPQVHLPIQLAVLEVQDHPRYPRHAAGAADSPSSIRW